jgi:hypothetical protein
MARTVRHAAYRLPVGLRRNSVDGCGARNDDATGGVPEDSPGVADSLKRLKSFGCLLIAYTESMEFYTTYRLKKLNLDSLLDYLYSPQDHDLPTGLSRQQIRSYSPEH